jgi:hypothetical protein
MLRKQLKLNVDEAELGSCCVVWKVVGTEDAEREYARMELLEVRAQNASPCKCICSDASLVRPKFRHAQIIL